MVRYPGKVEKVPTVVPDSVAVSDLPAQPVEPLANVAAEQGTPSVTVTQLSELDSYILERQKGQPKTLEDVARRVETLDRKARERHRLSLPEFFEKLSYDHNSNTPGAYMFRWIFKDKRGIDKALNVIGWTLVNRTYFPDAPRHLFTANGGIEIGDAILGFMPAAQALSLRKEPGQRSQDRVASRTTQVEQDYVLMTGNPKDERVYKPDMGTEEAEEAPASVRGELVEGRDF